MQHFKSTDHIELEAIGLVAGIVTIFVTTIVAF